jgi:penicillin-binding protein 1C
MSQRYDPRDRRFRRSLAGRPLPRRRPTPAILRGIATTKTGQAPKLVARLLLALVLLGAVMAMGSAGSAYGAYAQLANSLKPRLDQIAKHDSFQTTRIYDRNNVLLYEFFGAGKRTRVELDQVAPMLVQATIAIEDKTFFENQGVDYEGILKAFYRSVSAGEETGGASTITQQLIKQVVLTDDERVYENRYRRKMTEIILARELTEQYTKDEILELYLNEIYYGNLAYGIEAASEAYFDKHANELNLAQASLLAGLPQLPSYYDPIAYLDGKLLKGVRLEDGWLEPTYQFPNGTPPAKERQAAVLTQMVDEGYISELDARRAAAEDLVFADQEVPLNAPHFVFYVRRLLEEQYGEQFANKGLSIYTTLDLEMQRMVQQKAAERIQELEERNIHNAAVVVMQPNTGHILAMVGSIDYNKVLPTRTPGEEGNVVDGQVNVTTRERQPGSALKPFTYLSAMEHGMTPASVIWDVPTKYPLVSGRWYEPENYNGRWNGPVRIRTALANSLNMPAVKALKFAGINDTIDLLHRAGISGLRRGDQHYGLALTLGGGEVTPLDLTAAYNTLASGGTYYPPMAILKIVDGNGNLTELKPQPRPEAIDPNHAAIVTNMLSDDNARRPVWGLNSKLKLSRPAAVKTGTTNDWRDAWAVGFTPYVTVGVWTGNNNNEPTAKVESLSGGGIIWHNVMEELFSNERFDRLLRPNPNATLDFTLPSEVVRRPICALPGPFGGYQEELFSPDMLNPRATSAGTAVPSENRPATGDRFGCDIYKRLTVAALGDTPIAATEGVTGTGRLSLRYCIPQDGQQIPDDLIRTIYVPNLPEPDPSERVEYRWSGFGGEVDGRVVAAVDPSQIPPCSDAVLAAVAPPGSVRMPDLRMLGENQAKERLAALGVTNIYVDYQSRERIPEVYDQFGPYVVLSSLPAAGEWITSGTTVVLGIRAPDPAEPPPPPPDQPATP